jgi:Catalytic LigB subunit of aromatic ring-opening dioxygenase
VARISTVIASSHSPFLFRPLEWWNATRDARRRLANAPIDSDQENASKLARTAAAFDQLRKIFLAAEPDVVIVFGDDQEEQFTLHNLPAFAVYVGGDLEGYKELSHEGVPGAPGQRQLLPKSAATWARVPTRPDFAKAVLGGMQRRGFDPAFMLSLPNEAHGLGHAFMRPLGKLTEGRFHVPLLPVMVNCFYAPQPSAARCVQAARAIRDAVEAWPQDLKVAVVGSGGLWHTPGALDAYIDEAFDLEILARLRQGDADGIADYFDHWEPAAERKHLRCYESFSGGTGMSGGIGNGAGETRNWIMAAALADCPATVIDYVPVHASPCGMGFAYWDMERRG